MLRLSPLPALCLGALAANLAGCAAGTAPPSPTSSPMPLADLQRLYTSAAATYDRTETAIEQQEYRSCPGGSGPESLAGCESALSDDRQVTLAFDDSLRGIVFPASAAAAIGTLLTDDSSLEALQEQAATAPSLTAISSLTTRIFGLYAKTTSDSAAVRAALGLPPASASASPTPVD